MSDERSFEEVEIEEVAHRFYGVDPGYDVPILDSAEIEAIVAAAPPAAPGAPVPVPPPEANWLEAFI